MGDAGSRGTAIARHSVINVLGQTLPSLAALVAIPILLHTLGNEKLGVLLLIWAVVGWFSLFDAGLGRATTRAVSTRLGTATESEVRSLALISLGLLGALGLLGGGIAGLTAGWMTEAVIKVSPALTQETRGGFIALATAIPIVLLTAGARGLLEGRQRFIAVNAIRVPATLSLFLAPVAMLPFSHDLRALTLAIVVTRVLALGAFLAVGFRGLPDAGDVRPARSAIRELLVYAGWTGLTNLLGALMAMAYVDRFVIAALRSVEDSAYYSTPFEVVSRLWLVPMALMAVVFPALASGGAASQVPLLYHRAVRWTVAAMVPPTLIIVASADQLLTAWLGVEYAQQSTVVAQLLALGVLCEGIAQAPFTLLQAIGRSDLTAKRHLAQLPLYLPAIYFMTETYGVTGTAVVWLAWAASDAFVLFLLARRVLGTADYPRAQWLVAVAVLFGCALVIRHINAFALQASLTCVIVAIAGAVLWRRLLTASERQTLVAVVRRRSARSLIKRGSA